MHSELFVTVVLGQQYSFQVPRRKTCEVEGGLAWGPRIATCMKLRDLDLNADSAFQRCL